MNHLPKLSKPLPHAVVVLSTAHMAAADQWSIAQGTPEITLVQRAGLGIARCIYRRFAPCHTLVLCGPGNNGADGYILAQTLRSAGWPVQVLRSGLAKSPAAVHAAQAWQGTVLELNELTTDLLKHTGLIVDALFGAGLDRPLEPNIVQALNACYASQIPMVAVDVPSGLMGDTGVLDPALLAHPVALTTTFFRKKPAHLLAAGRQLCGDIKVIDIGIADHAFLGLNLKVFENHPVLWREYLPKIASSAHKFVRGHALIWGGFPSVGAAQLAAHACGRSGAGVVTLLVQPQALTAYTAQASSVMVKLSDPDQVALLTQDARSTAGLIGPGAGLSDTTQSTALHILQTHMACVLDADALTVFSKSPNTLFQAIAANPARPCVLTPHEGEFARLFNMTGSKLQRALAASQLSGAVLVLKGADTIIAAPDGRAVINCHAPASLATAGAGDVLAGIITGLLAQGMPAFEAACAAVWLHGAAAANLPPYGLLAQDLADQLPQLLTRLH